MPESIQERIIRAEENLAALHQLLGDTLHVEGHTGFGQASEVVRRRLEELRLVPEIVLRRLRREGLRAIVIAPHPVTQFVEFARFGSGRLDPHGAVAWEDISCVYDHFSKVILLGDGPQDEPGFALHEIGHALGDLLGYDEDIRLMEGFIEDIPDSYLRMYRIREPHNGRRWRREFFAFSVAYVILRSGKAKRRFSHGYYTFLTECVLQCKPPRAK